MSTDGLTPGLVVWALLGVVMIAGAAIAAYATRLKHAVYGLWFAGLASAGLYLYFGAEFLALLTALLTTVISLALLFLAAQFGLFLESPPKVRGPLRRTEILQHVAAGSIGAAFVFAVWIVSRSVDAVASRAQPLSGDLAKLGEFFVREGFATVEILAFSLLIGVVAVGVTLRTGRTKDVSGTTGGGT